MLSERKFGDANCWSFEDYEACCSSIMKADWIAAKSRIAILNHFMETHEDILIAPGKWNLKKTVTDLPEYRDGKLHDEIDRNRKEAFANQLPTY